MTRRNLAYCKRNLTYCALRIMAFAAERNARKSGFRHTACAVREVKNRLETWRRLRDNDVHAKWALDDIKKATGALDIDVIDTEKSVRTAVANTTEANEKRIADGTPELAVVVHIDQNGELGARTIDRNIFETYEFRKRILNRITTVTASIFALGTLGVSILPYIYAQELLIAVISSLLPMSIFSGLLTWAFKSEIKQFYDASAEDMLKTLDHAKINIVNVLEMMTQLLETKSSVINLLLPSQRQSHE